MIINDKYKVSWKHYNKELDKPDLSKEDLKIEIFKAISSSSRIEAMDRISSLLETKETFNQSFSRCIIEELTILEGEAKYWATFSSGMALVHPNDNFNRKKGVLISFDDAVSNVEDRSIRTLLWNAFWKVREPKREKIVLHTERDRHLRVFLEETSRKSIRGKHIIYTIPENTEIWFPRND